MKTGILYLFSIAAANLLVAKFGIVHAGPLFFPAGAVVVGLTFSLRDLVQRRFGKWRCWYWTLAAALLSATFSWEVAAASLTAFLASEAVDWAVFTWSSGGVRKRMLLSNLFGAPLDSLVFVPLVFGWVWPAVLGQAVIKLASSLAIIPFIKK